MLDAEGVRRWLEEVEASAQATADTIREPPPQAESDDRRRPRALSCGYDPKTPPPAAAEPALASRRKTLNPLAARPADRDLTGPAKPGVRGAGAPVEAPIPTVTNFAELRGYVAGDDPRRIDWAATARAGALRRASFSKPRADVRPRPWTPAARCSSEARAATTTSPPTLPRFGTARRSTKTRCARVTAEGLVFARDLRGPRRSPVVRPSNANRPARRFAASLEIRSPRFALGESLADIGFLENRRARSALARLRRALRPHGVARLRPVAQRFAGSPASFGCATRRAAEQAATSSVHASARATSQRFETRERRVLGRLMRFGVRAAILDEGGPEIAFFEAFGIA